MSIRCIAVTRIAQFDRKVIKQSASESFNLNSLHGKKIVLELEWNESPWECSRPFFPELKQFNSTHTDRYVLRMKNDNVKPKCTLYASVFMTEYINMLKYSKQMLM